MNPHVSSADLSGVRSKDPMSRRYVGILKYLLIIGCIFFSLFISVPFAKLSRIFIQTIPSSFWRIFATTSVLKLVALIVSSICPPGFHDKKPIWIHVRPSWRERDGNDQLPGAPLRPKITTKMHKVHHSFHSDRPDWKVGRTSMHLWLEPLRTASSECAL